MSKRDKIGIGLLFGGLVAVCAGFVAPAGVIINPHRNNPVVYNYRITQESLRAVQEKDYPRRAKIENQLRNMEKNPEITNYNDWNSTYVGWPCFGLIFGGLGASGVGMAFGASHLVRKEDLKRYYNYIVNSVGKKD